MTDLAETPDEHTQEWSPNARGCPQNAREPLLGTERGWTYDRPPDCDVEPPRLNAAKPLVIERVSSTLRIEGRQEPLGQAYLVMSADDEPPTPLPTRVHRPGRPVTRRRPTTASGVAATATGQEQNP